MDCRVIDEALVPYVLGACEDEERETIDRHLLECGRCLRAFLAMKRHVERGSRERPSEHARAKLRAEVLATFRPSLGARARRALARPIPLYQGAVAAALAVAVAWIAPTIARRASTPTPRSEQRIDTSRSSATSLHIY